MAAASNLPRPDEDSRAWFERIVSDHYRFLYATAARVLRRREDVEDAVQNGVLKAMQRLDQLAEPKAVVGWLGQIVRHAAIDIARKPARATTSSELLDSSALAPVDDGPAEDEVALVLEEVEQLPPSQADVLTLRFVEGLSVSELAERLGITPNAARVRMFRGYERLRGNSRLRKALGIES
ncbi:MAG: sigma-70 family RNA polymerase sigma factor [Planctomycetota bacterium]